MYSRRRRCIGKVSFESTNKINECVEGLWEGFCWKLSTHENIAFASRHFINITRITHDQELTWAIACWASSGSAAAGGCGHLEKALRECMDAPVSTLLFSILLSTNAIRPIIDSFNLSQTPHFDSEQILIKFNLETTAQTKVKHQLPSFTSISEYSWSDEEEMKFKMNVHLSNTSLRHIDIKSGIQC